MSGIFHFILQPFVMENNYYTFIINKFYVTSTNDLQQPHSLMTEVLEMKKQRLRIENRKGGEEKGHL